MASCVCRHLQAWSLHFVNAYRHSMSLNSISVEPNCHDFTWSDMHVGPDSGYWKRLPRGSTKRQRGCAFNQPATGPPSRWDASAPAEKTSMDFYRAAQAADEAMGEGRSAANLEGVKGSHAFMKLPYWDEALFRVPDPMHTISNEVYYFCSVRIDVIIAASILYLM